MVGDEIGVEGISVLFNLKAGTSFALECGLGKGICRWRNLSEKCNYFIFPKPFYDTRCAPEDKKALARRGGPIGRVRGLTQAKNVGVRYM